MRALPFRLPPESVVEPGQWTLVDGEDRRPMPEALEFWDYNTTVAVERVVSVDLEKARNAAGLAPDTDLALSVIWTASGSKLRGTACRNILTDSEPVTLEVRLPGHDLGGTLTLDTVLVLAHRRVGNDRPTAARRAGSVMWSDSAQLRLQGDAPQMPLSIVDFKNTTYPWNAAWYLQLDTDLDAAAMGSMWLLVNEAIPAAAAAVTNAQKPRPEDEIVLSMLQVDTARIMIEHGLRNPEFNEKARYPRESLGRAIQDLFGQLFKGRSIEDLRRVAEEQPNVFAAEVQSAARIFQGGR